jgi:2-polyprenyl-6-methoxyphenol hydroxylase-like FAD-dependent oxidoreductase
MNHNNVIIIGSGIAGIATALFLRKAGIKSTVYEGRTGELEKGAGFLLTPNGVNVLAEIGCKDKVIANSTIIKSIYQLNSQNEIESITYNYNEKYYKSPMINVMRSNIVKVLLEEAQRQGIEIMYDKKLISVHQSSKSVEAFFEDGTSVKGDIVVGADGTFSKTREAVASDAKLDYSGMWGLQGISYVDDFEWDESSGYLYYDENLSFVFGKAHPKNKMNILWQAFSIAPEKLPTKDFEKASTHTIRELLNKMMKDWKVTNNLFKIVENTEQIFARSIHEVKNLPTWSKGRVVLVGDAVHTANPFVGQGASYSLEDAMVLAKNLRDHDYRDAFYYYEKDRRKRTEELNALFLNKHMEFNMDKKINEYKITWE